LEDETDGGDGGEEEEKQPGAMMTVGLHNPMKDGRFDDENGEGGKIMRL